MKPGAVEKAPNALFSAGPSSGPAPLAVSFDATESGPEGTIVEYDWDFGDGQTGTGVVTNHWYTRPGTYTVTLIVTDVDGRTDSAAQDITVY